MATTSTNVLIVDTDYGQIELAQELVKEAARANVDSTNSGDRAIELVSKTNYQLVVVDCSTGGDMDGLSLLERIKRVSPTTGVILTSSFATIEEAVKATRLGADEYFKKPYNPEQFRLAVSRCLERRALYTGDQGTAGLMLLLNSSQLISGCYEEDKLFDTVTGYLKRETGAQAIALFRREKSGEKIWMPTASDDDPEVVEVLVEGHAFIQACFEEKTSMKVFPKSTSTAEIAVFQFRAVGDAMYFVVCVAPKWPTSSDEVDSRFRLLQAQIQMTGRNIQNYRGVRHLLYLDEPTGLYNTRYMHRCLDHYFEKRQTEPTVIFSVLFIDVDKFKRINDEYGHLIGTKLLSEMAQIIKKCLRKEDIAFRYGGDEFVLLLVGADTSTAHQIAENVRQAVEQNIFLSKENLNVKLTVSIGVANCPEHAASKRDFIDAADGAMYAVKRSTRNNVYVAEKKAA